MALTNQIRYVYAGDTSVTTGAGKTGLAHSDIAAAYLVNGGTLTLLTTETVTTLGTYQAPTSAAHIRIRELSGSDPTKGIYEVHFHDTQLASGSRLWLFLSAANSKFSPLEVSLTNELGLSAGDKTDIADAIAADIILALGESLAPKVINIEVTP